MNYSDGMQIVQALTEIKNLTNNSEGQALIIKIFEDYLKMMYALKQRDKKVIDDHIYNLLGNDDSMIRLFIDIERAIINLKKLDGV